MPGEVTIQFAPGDVDRAVALMQRFQAETHKPIEDTLRWMAWLVLSSVGASTKSAPKTRKLYKNRGNSVKYKPGEFPHYVKYWVRYGTRSGAPHQEPRYIKAGEEQTSEYRLIKRAGLAKASWMWGLADIGKRATPPQPRIPGVMTVEQLRSALDPAVIMTNRLSYIMRAMRGSGPRAISGAMDRAVRRGEHILEQRLGRLAART